MCLARGDLHRHKEHMPLSHEISDSIMVLLMAKLFFWLSYGVLCLAALGAPALLGANREWSVALVTMGLAVALLSLAIGRQDLFSLRRGAPLWQIRWITGSAIVFFIIAAVPLIFGSYGVTDPATLTEISPARLPPDRTMIFQALLGYTATCLALLTAYLIGTATPGARRLLLYLFLGTCVVYALYGIATDCIGDVRACQSVAAPFINRNSAATYFGFGVIVSLLCLTQYLRGLINAASRPQSRLGVRLVNLASTAFGTSGALAGAFLITGAGLLLTQSRGGAISVAIALLFAALMIWRRMGMACSVSRLAVLAVAILVSLVWASASSGLVGRLQQTDLTGDARLMLYERTAEMIMERPLTGHGLGTFQERFTQYRTADMPPYPDYDKAHNSYLDLAAGVGVPAALLVLAMMTWIFGACLEAYFRAKRQHIAPLIGAALIVQVGVHSLVDFSMQIPGVQVNFAFAVGLALAAAISVRKTKLNDGS